MRPVLFSPTFHHRYKLDVCEPNCSPLTILLPGIQSLVVKVAVEAAVAVDVTAVAVADVD